MARSLVHPSPALDAPSRPDAGPSNWAPRETGEVLVADIPAAVSSKTFRLAWQGHKKKTADKWNQ
jgi:hypothetical protein